MSQGKTEIRVEAQVYKVTTLADGGIRVYLDLPGSAGMQAAQFIELTKPGILVDLIATPRIVNGGKAPSRTQAKKREPKGD